MSDNLPNIPLPVNEWLDLYQSSGVTVGTSLSVDNVGVCDIYLAVQAAQPSASHDSYNVLQRDNGVRLQNNSGDLGAWAYCNTAGGKINVQPEQDTGFYPHESVGLKTATGEQVDVQNPLPVDGDSVYSKDLDYDLSSQGTFVGDLPSLFNDYEAEIIDTGATNPKIITLRFLRPIKSNSIGVGARTGNFSNVKISLKDLAGNVRNAVADNANSTKYTSNIYDFTTSVFIEVVIEFLTADPIHISGLLIHKVQSRSISAIDGLIPIRCQTKELLLANEEWTSGVIDTNNYVWIISSVHSDVASADEGFVVEFSSDKTNWYWPSTYTILAGSAKTFSDQPVARFIRIRYKNGGTDQGVFEVVTQLKPVASKSSSHRLADELSGQDDAELVKAGSLGPDQSGIFRNGRMTEVGAQLVSDFLVEVARGNIPGYSAARKFGYNPAVTTATADIYEWGATSGAEKMTFAPDGTAPIDRLSSDNIADTQSVVVDGLDINGDEVIQELDLTGQTPVALITNLWRVNRVYNNNSIDTLGNVYVFVDGATTGGVPNDVTAVRGYFSIANQQTLQGVYTVPNGKKGYFYWLRPSIVKKQAASAIYTAKFREYGKVARTQDIFGLTTTGTSKSSDEAAIPVEVLGRTDFIPSADPDSTLGFSVSYQLLLIDD